LEERISMIKPAYVRTMAAYNSEMNRRLYGAASRLSDAERKADRGAFWGSIHRTLAHILWGDRTWMSLFADWEKPTIALRQSGELFGDFTALQTSRIDADRCIEQWAATVDQAWLDRSLEWFSGAAQRQMSMPCGMLVAHFFNHQTHHRGQAHALITAAGERTGDTDLFLVVPEVRA
jgi:uncharacterized damage-inducible protein DinB